ncbi:excisionase family DNA-binding protein [Nocardia farcinica]|uniref:excisionase family DNA-binding protein n=1 Tax=Nocardia farcinica TaxID=37329 RepID=UPI0018959069|nr:helix-turn-helix domain-containing protein [Nocardia farcinica]MBF6070135.1 helix-turn-helix domain-containing protein [Nocardia farcinica]
MNTTTRVDPLNELRTTATVSVERAGEYLGVSRGYAYAMARDGRLPVIKVGPRRMRVKSAALLAMIESDSAVA